MSSSTRREFLATTPFVLTGSLLSARGLSAHILRGEAVYSPLPASAFLTAAPLDLCALATHAIDTAKSAGATYADVRVAEQHLLDLRVYGTNVAPAAVTIAPQYSYGIRVLMNGTWAFVHGTAPSRDAIVTSVHNAVATARSFGQLNRTHAELAPAPAVTGEWETPVQMDPFTIPLGDQFALMSACANAAARVRNGFPSMITTFRWTRETRVFASTEGTLTTQTLRRFEPEVQSGGDVLKSDRTAIWIPVLQAASGGYECVTMPDLQDDIKRAAEDAAWMASLPRRTLEVGRYPAVFDGTTLGVTLSRTLGVALELDRALGYEAGAGGTSFLSPPSDILGTLIASPLLSVTANRASPSITAVKWDDEGVESRSFSLIAEGRLMGYHMSRQTAADVTRAGQPMRSNGCAVAPDAGRPVLVRTPHLTVAPAVTRATLETLCTNITRGVLVYHGSYVLVDYQVSSGSIMPWGGNMFEIEKGKIVRWLRGNGMQFETSRFWKSLTAIGDASTVRPVASQLWKGEPNVEAWQSASAPAGLFKDVSVINTRVQT